MLHVKKEMVVALFQTLSGLLSLGSVLFSENPNGDSVVQSHDQLKRASELLGTNLSLLLQALCSRTMKLKGSEMQIPLKPDEARSSRDALAKAVYSKLFLWVVQQVGCAAAPPLCPLPLSPLPSRPFTASSFSSLSASLSTLSLTDRAGQLVAARP